MKKILLTLVLIFAITPAFANDSAAKVLGQMAKDKVVTDFKNFWKSSDQFSDEERAEFARKNFNRYFGDLNKKYAQELAHLSKKNPNDDAAWSMYRQYRSELPYMAANRVSYDIMMGWIADYKEIIDPVYGEYLKAYGDFCYASKYPSEYCKDPKNFNKFVDDKYYSLKGIELVGKLKSSKNKYMLSVN